MLFWKPKPALYIPVLEKETDTSLLNDAENQEIRAILAPRSLTERLFASFWIFSTFSLAILSTLLAFRQPQLTLPKSRLGSYEGGFINDLDAATPSIQLVETKFTGALHVDENGNWSRLFAPGDKKYSGPPSEEIDIAWEELIAPMHIDITGSESETVKGTTVRWPGKDVYLSGLNVYHGLHCVNAIRKALNPEYYGPISSHPMGAQFSQLHIDHCIEYLRQSTQCAGDLSPMEWIWSSALGHTVLKAGTTHTCRDFDSVHKWASEHPVDPEIKELYVRPP